MGQVICIYPYVPLDPSSEYGELSVLIASKVTHGGHQIRFRICASSLVARLCLCVADDSGFEGCPGVG